MKRLSNCDFGSLPAPDGPVRFPVASNTRRAADTGSIEVGKRADLVIHAVPNRYHMVYRFGVRRVRTVIAAGQVVVEDGTLRPSA